jgi:hypothetical protein
MQGFKDAQSGGPAMLTTQQVTDTWAQFAKMAQAKEKAVQTAMLQGMAVTNKAAGAAFQQKQSRRGHPA